MTLTFDFELAAAMPATTLPPFPDNVPIQDLVVVDYDLIRKGDENEIDTLWKAATVRGFW